MASNLVVKHIFPCRIVLRRASTDIEAVRFRQSSVSGAWMGRAVPIILRNIVAESAIGA